MSRLAIVVAAALLIASMAAAQTTRPVDSPRAARLIHDLRQRDSDETRSKAVAELRAMLRGDAVAQAEAMTALSLTADVRFDRGGFEGDVVPLLGAQDAEVRRAALGALVVVKPDPSCLPAVAALAKDPSPLVRAGVMSSVTFIRAGAKIIDPIGEPALTLLADADRTVVRETARSLWGVAVTPDVEAKVIDLSKFSDHGAPHSDSIAYDMNYFVLSTRPVISGPVGKRLAEIARHPGLSADWAGRAVWGMARPAEPAAVETLTKALIEELDHSTVAYNREWAVRGLSRMRTEAALKKLKDVAERDESESVRALAARAVRE